MDKRAAAHRSRSFIARMLACFVAAAMGLAHAQDYPAKPVRVVVPNAPGSLNDTVARLVFSRVGEALQQQFIIDNRPGAGGSIGADAVAKAAPDGHHLLVSANTILVVNPFLYSKLAYDPLRDFEPVSMLVKISEVLIVHPSLGIRTLEQFVRLAKGRPGQIPYASGGNGHPTHLMMELLQRKAAMRLAHVPYKGTTPAMQAMLSGEVGAFNIGIGLAQPHLARNRVLALAKTGLPARDILPEVPPLTRFYPDAEYIPWQATFAPKGTPQRIVTKLNAEIAKALASADIAARLRNLHLAPSASSASELDAVLRADLGVNRDLVAAIGLKLD